MAKSKASPRFFAASKKMASPPSKAGLAKKMASPPSKAGLAGPPPKAGKGKAKGEDKAEAAPAKAPMRMPWWAKQQAVFRMAQAKAMPKKGAGKGKQKDSATETAKNFLARPNNKRLNDAAAVAQEYFKPSDAA